MNAFIDLVVGLCRLRRAPQEFPHAPRLALLLLAAATLLDSAIGVVLGDGDTAPMRSLLSSIVVLGLCWVALAIRKLGHRYVQTATALLTCSIAFSLLQLPVAMIAGPVPEAAAELGAAQIVLGWFTLGLFFWQIAVNAHIVRHAMDSSFGFALGLVATWVLAFWALDHALFALPN
ncbi:MAG: hypothetical protein EOP90_14830 [Lysobacteraceae bacterium]|nr:MAG: hypothetical protein EOP90_14830 [Xanthomonadaceae bacterium]